MKYDTWGNRELIAELTKRDKTEYLVMLLQQVQNQIAHNNKTEGIDIISDHEMDVQRVIGIVQSL